MWASGNQNNSSQNLLAGHQQKSPNLAPIGAGQTSSSNTNDLSASSSSNSDSSQQQQQQQQQVNPAQVNPPSSLVGPSPASNVGQTMQIPTVDQLLAQNNDPHSQGDKISFFLKSSIFLKRVTLDSNKMALGLIKQLAIAFINEIYFSSLQREQQYQQQNQTNSFISEYIKRNYSTPEQQQALFDRLRLHVSKAGQENNNNSMILFNLVSDIEPESHVCIEVCGPQRPAQNQPVLSQQQSSNLLISGTKQLAAPQNNNNSNSAINFNSEQNPSQIQVHEFKPESFLFPTYCATCSPPIKGVFRGQGFQCQLCKKNFCPKCKARATELNEACFLQHQSPQTTLLVVNNQLQSENSSSQPSANASLTSDTNVSPNASNPGDASNNLQAKVENPAACMSKRKSTSNLLHFNILLPFQSKTSQQSAGQSNSRNESKSSRGSAGALDPVLQQLGKPRDQSDNKTSGGKNQASSQATYAGDFEKLQANITGSGCGGNGGLVVAQQAHLSSSHQNLYSLGGENYNDSKKMVCYTDESLGASSSQLVQQSQHQLLQQAQGGVAVKNCQINYQISNSARSSINELHSNSPIKLPRDQTNHQFVMLRNQTINSEESSCCDVCKKLLQFNCTNVNQQPSICKSCKLKAHIQCQRLVLTDCMTRIADQSKAAAAAQGSIGVGNGTSTNAEKHSEELQQSQEEDSSLRNQNSNMSRDNIRLHRLTPSVKHIKRPDSTKPIIEGWLKHTTLSDELTRKHYWRLDETDITLYENDTSMRYFRAISLNKIIRVMSAESLPKVIKEDVLISSIFKTSKDQLAAAAAANDCAGDEQKAKSATTSPVRISAKSPELRAQMRAMFAFELTTGSMYLVQADNEQEATRWRDQLLAITKLANDKRQQSIEEATTNECPNERTDSEDSKLCNTDKLALVKERDIKRDGAKIDEDLASEEKDQIKMDDQLGQKNVPASVRVGNMQRQHHHRYPPGQHSNRAHHHHHHHHKTYTDPNRSRLYNRPRITIKLDSFNIPDHLIEGKYLIERDRVKGVGFEELGSGQFGKVYAAISEWKVEDTEKGLWSGVPVAIKEISKARFDLRQQAKLKNEANILSRLDHPGVIILERVHDLIDKIYIVMEQLEDDMLEMIVSTPEKRLNERITKFLTYQILEALKYLHSQNIAHCDLKPENVLLVERRSQFPQIKLCDFGFAKIIEENSFRSSLVGTPAYLAPEVVKGERYNRSVDLWSVGVIVYVSLSGEFPFNEGENIHDQISRANFMYPDQPWAKISMQAKNFINSLLRVNCEKRLSANRAQMDDWIQDYQLWCDLSELEVRVGKRWVTDDADFERWSRYAREHQLQLPRSAIQLHEELIAD